METYWKEDASCKSIDLLMQVDLFYIISFCLDFFYFIVFCDKSSQKTSVSLQTSGL